MRRMMTTREVRALIALTVVLLAVLGILAYTRRSDSDLPGISTTDENQTIKVTITQGGIDSINEMTPSPRQQAKQRRKTAKRLNEPPKPLSSPLDNPVKILDR